MYDTPRSSALHALHQPERLYAKAPCTECQAKQAYIDKLRTALAGLVGESRWSRKTVESAFDGRFGMSWYIFTPDMTAALDTLEATATKETTAEVQP